jgi:hypothetical protein
MSKDFCCWNCGAQLSIEQLFGHEQDRAAFGRLALLSVPVGTRVMQYLALFAPAKNRMTLSRKAKLLEELLPDLQRRAITRNGRDWAAPLEAWSLAIDGMLALRDQGKLTLPLTGHGYLHAVLQGMADKAESAAEKETEETRRAERPAQAAAGPLAAADALPRTLGMPDHIKAQAEAIRRGMPIPRSDT